MNNRQTIGTITQTVCNFTKMLHNQEKKKKNKIFSNINYKRFIFSCVLAKMFKNNVLLYAERRFQCNRMKTQNFNEAFYLLLQLNFIQTFSLRFFIRCNESSFHFVLISYRLQIL